MLLLKIKASLVIDEVIIHALTNWMFTLVVIGCDWFIG